MVLVSAYLVFAPFYETPLQSFYCLLFVSAGIPFYLVFVRYKVVPPKFLRFVGKFMASSFYFLRIRRIGARLSLSPSTTLLHPHSLSLVFDPPQFYSFPWVTDVKTLERIKTNVTFDHGFLSFHCCCRKCIRRKKRPIRNLKI